MRAAVLLMLVWGGCLAGPAGGAELGRLFTTPQERARLDAQLPVSGPSRNAGDPSGSETKRGLLTVNGVVTGSDGRRIVWLNGRQRTRGVVLKEDAQVLVRRVGVTLKAGQSFDLRRGRIHEAYENALDTR